MIIYNEAEKNDCFLSFGCGLILNVFVLVVAYKRPKLNIRLM